MSTAEMKLDLMRKIDNLNDNQLKDAQNYFQYQFDGNDHDEWDNLDPQLKAKIEQGLEELAHGDVYSAESVVNEVKSKYGLK